MRTRYRWQEFIYVPVKTQEENEGALRDTSRGRVLFKFDGKETTLGRSKEKMYKLWLENHDIWEERWP